MPASTATFRPEVQASEVMQTCAEHAIQKHDMKGFVPELYVKMRRCVRTLEEGAAAPQS